MPQYGISPVLPDHIVDRLVIGRLILFLALSFLEFIIPELPVSHLMIAKDDKLEGIPFKVTAKQRNGVALHPEFDPRLYGDPVPVPLLKSLHFLEIRLIAAV